VLVVVGGVATTGATGSAELYDPDTLPILTLLSPAVLHFLIA
jgi:hypothetical protein